MDITPLVLSMMKSVMPPEVMEYVMAVLSELVARIPRSNSVPMVTFS